MKTYLFTIPLSVTILLVGLAWAEPTKKLTSEMDNINYSVGYQMGTDFKNQGWELKSEAMLQGIQDSVNSATPLMTDEMMKATLANMKRKLLLAQDQVTIDYQRASAEFMKENSKKEGVVVLPSGVQYKVLKEGTVKIPTLEDTVRIHFKLYKVDGVEVGSTYPNSDPRVVPLATAMPGLQEVMTRMKEGSKYQIVLPKGMAASNREKDDSGAMIYDMELISIKPKV